MLSCRTLSIMMEEFTKAAESVAELLLTAEVDWSRLFEPYPFFSLFKNFLQVSCTTSSPPGRCAFSSCVHITCSTSSEHVLCVLEGWQ